MRKSEEFAKGFPGVGGYYKKKKTTVIWSCPIKYKPTFMLLRFKWLEQFPRLNVFTSSSLSLFIFIATKKTVKIHFWLQRWGRPVL